MDLLAPPSSHNTWGFLQGVRHWQLLIHILHVQILSMCHNTQYVCALYICIYIYMYIYMYMIVYVYRRYYIYILSYTTYIEHDSTTHKILFVYICTTSPWAFAASGQYLRVGRTHLHRVDPCLRRSLSSHQRLAGLLELPREHTENCITYKYIQISYIYIIYIYTNIYINIHVFYDIVCIDWFMLDSSEF